MIEIDTSGTDRFISLEEVKNLKAKNKECNYLLHSKLGKGSDFLGWVDISNMNNAYLTEDILETASIIRSKVEVVVTIGIGGSYLGSKAVIEALSDSFLNYNCSIGFPLMLFAGHHLSEDYLYELLAFLSKKEFALIVISKSGTTTEPAIAFRILKKLLVDKYGCDEASKRIIAITDRERGALKKMSDENGYKTYVIPDDVGGRFSVFSAVGLVPIALAGFDIKSMLAGAFQMYENTKPEVETIENPAELYALYRNLLYNKSYSIEILVNFEPKLKYISEWWKQLYGESEGKEGKGIFPCSANFTTDLHSMGQYIQEGKRFLFETIISVLETKHVLKINEEKRNLDNLNYLSGRKIDEINKSAENGTVKAHIDGGVPVIKIRIPKLNEFYLGQLLYFFEKACGISGYVLNVNPFDQPGVEEYKKNMFQILGKK